MFTLLEYMEHGVITIYFVDLILLEIFKTWIFSIGELAIWSPLIIMRSNNSLTSTVILSSINGNYKSQSSLNCLKRKWVLMFCSKFHVPRLIERGLNSLRFPNMCSLISIGVITVT